MSILDDAWAIFMDVAGVKVQRMELLERVITSEWRPLAAAERLPNNGWVSFAGYGIPEEPNAQEIDYHLGAFCAGRGEHHKIMATVLSGYRD
ncbi:hypothetical protein HYY74_00690 [Candidatus Woesearchaeota archaeon]|nr:hypothetical protein [Candidatus Woesearchaeota archaeon]